MKSASSIGIFFAGALSFIPSLLNPMDAWSLDAANYPKLKDGEWEMSVRPEKLPEGLPPSMFQTMRTIYCIDAATQDKLIAQSQATSECDKPTVVKTGNNYVADVSCNVGGVKSKAHIETSFVGDTEIKNRVTIESANSPSMTMVATGKHMGACKEGRKPGDMVMLGPDGKPVNLGNFQQLSKTMKPPGQ
jgi:hypothetical protein